MLSFSKTAETVVAAAQRVVAASAAGRRVDAEVAPQRLRGGEGQEQREGDGGPLGPVPVRFLLHGASFCDDCPYVFRTTVEILMSFKLSIFKLKLS